MMINGPETMEKRGSEGIVHGHIHNYDNMTYIHGHVHHTSASGIAEGYDTGPELAPSPNQTFTANQMSLSKSMDKSADCRYFQIINFHQNKMLSSEAGKEPGFGMNKVDDLRSTPQTSRYNDDFLLLPRRKRKLSNNATDENCECPPKVLEICCDMQHSSSKGEEKDKVAPEALPTVKNEETPRYRADNSQFFPSPMINDDNGSNFNFNQLLPIDCEMPCQQAPKAYDSESEEDENKDEDIFEKFCKECLDLGHEPKHLSSSSNGHDDQDNATHVHHSHHHNHSTVSGKHAFDTPLSTASTTSAEESLPSLPRKEQHNCAQPETTCDTPMKNSSGHVANSQIDLKILNDLCNISSLYEFPFANHMNHHNHNHEHKENECINLLESSINDTGNSLYELNENSSQNHHHHRVQLHGHMANCHSTTNTPKLGSQWNDKSFSGERSTIPDNAVKLEDSNMVNPTVKSVDCFGISQESNTIAFNWAFKNEDNAIKCEWDQCPESYSNLIDLQKHMLKDHVADEDASCNWVSCAFEGEDTCSLINHINTNHGINFGMNIADNSSLLEQRRQDRIQNIPQPKSQSSDNIPYFACKWGDCTEVFDSAAALTTHLEALHLEKGKSEYHCHWHGCDKRFAQRQKLVRHLKVHSGYKPYKCQDCGKCFSSEDTLTQHKRTHSGEKPFECRICGKRFAVSSSLKIHIRTHTGEKPLQCKICGRRFSESSNLNKHMKSHQKKYSCVHCQRGFDDAEKCKTHQSKCFKDR
ncbi:Zap1p TDEL_0D01950 [Torulaspora delbrueckii]|uniref:C2H2-type domain-containing protein n=1 Tax=Torulaspora delbrueckii TaxID=4950 RepID=G8ZT35_TORDE|nr:hypothetical protein TDEL_0D01950 [Torulaspora delbrueckii]CCE91779.1 hypothetical protein TDEL_0D01950 [Torulaspora delbrueckii]